ncbi:MAG: hypothetical protein EZS28_015116 [Streblomastix strix]|uniref:Uncharacterized protein n=1 Tax=Streblomastix strix TaxID=222440 RepID=A0A5J4W448_9EUKA|nr:MAG: hypothetical protein EZS28_015116 [Streblomastix strix]
MISIEITNLNQDDDSIKAYLELEFCERGDLSKYIKNMMESETEIRFDCGQRIGAEVNMSSSPKKLTFFIDDVEQQYYVINIPQAIRFWSYIYAPNSSFGVTRFERRSSSSAHGVTGSIGLEWGKEWDW